MPTLDDAIEELKAKHGFSDEAWTIFREAVGLSDEMVHRVDQLTKAVERLENSVGRCDCINCVFIGV